MRAALLCGCLAAAPALSAPPLAEAVTTGPTGFGILRGDPLGGWFEEGPGASRLEVAQDRGGFAEAQLSLPSGTVRVELQVHAPAWDLPVHGATGWGVPGAVSAHAAVALAGVGQLWREGGAPQAVRVQVLALSAGTHADDGTHGLLPAAREGDLELEWIIHGDTGGPLRLFFDDVRVSLRGVELPSTPSPGVAGVPAPNVGLSALTAPVASPAPPRGAGIPVAEGTVRVRNATPATPLPRTPRPANASAATPLPPGVSVTAGRVFVPLPATPSPTNAAAPPAAVPPPSSTVTPGAQLPAAVPVQPILPAIPLRVP
jgi:hypothetical protein